MGFLYGLLRGRGHGMPCPYIWTWSRVAVLGFIAFLVAAPAAENLTGTWMALIPASGRRFAYDIEFQLVQKIGSLSGKLYHDGVSSPIIEGSVNERGEVEFVIEAREQAGNQVNIVEYRFEGVVCGDGIEITRERATARDAVSGADVPVKRWNDSPEEDRRRRFKSFQLERLF